MRFRTDAGNEGPYRKQKTGGTDWVPPVFSQFRSFLVPFLRLQAIFQFQAAGASQTVARIAAISAVFSGMDEIFRCSFVVWISYIYGPSPSTVGAPASE